MSPIIFQRELLEFTRNTHFRLVFVVVVLLTAIAAADGWSRARDADRTRAMAEASDREVWVHQGQKNPHGAAHFSRYAFRPTPALAAFEPGVFDHAGAAVWMEAHYQDPATLRRAEDEVAFAPMPSISPGWVIRVIGSLALVVLLFSAIAGERQSGRLRSLVAAGVTARDLVAGKLAAAVTATIVLTAISLLVALVPLPLFGSELPGPDRLLALATVHALALTAIGLATVAVSARCRSTGAALLAAATLWIGAAIVVPLVAAQAAQSVYPDVDVLEFNDRLRAESQTAYWSGGAQEAAMTAYERRILAELGASSLEERGLSRRAIRLQAHEEFANAVFDRRYAELDARHDGQDRVASLAAALSPIVALQRLSAGIAGTDLRAQQLFARQAEDHRRTIIERLNFDLLHHSGGKGRAYTADRRLWERIPDFEGRSPALASVITHYRFELGALLAWLLVGAVAAGRFTSDAMRPEALSC